MLRTAIVARVMFDHHTAMVVTLIGVAVYAPTRQATESCHGRDALVKQMRGFEIEEINPKTVFRKGFPQVRVPLPLEVTALLYDRTGCELERTGSMCSLLDELASSIKSKEARASQKSSRSEEKIINNNLSC